MFLNRRKILENIYYPTPVISLKIKTFSKNIAYFFEREFKEFVDEYDRVKSTMSIEDQQKIEALMVDIHTFIDQRSFGYANQYLQEARELKDSIFRDKLFINPTYKIFDICLSFIHLCGIDRTFLRLYLCC